MKLTAFSHPGLPDGFYHDNDLNIDILIKDGQGVGVKQPDGGVAPFPYEFELSNNPVKDSQLVHRDDMTFAPSVTIPDNTEPPQTIWGIPVVFKSFLPEREGELPPHNWLMSVDPAVWPSPVAGIDFAVPGSDRTGFTLHSDELDTTLLSMLEDGQTDSVTGTFEIPEPDDFTEIPVTGITAPGGLGTAREFMQRFWEPEPTTARLMYRPGDKVKRIRKDLYGWVPVEAEGVIQSIEHPESHMASKGRHYSVSFDVSKYNIKIDDVLREAMRNSLPDGEPVPEYHGIVTVNVGVNDIVMVEKGMNWNPDYKQPYPEDSILEEMENMTPEQWQKSISEITDSLVGKLRAEKHPFGDLTANDLMRQEQYKAHQAATEAIERGVIQFPRLPREVLPSIIDKYAADYWRYSPSFRELPPEHKLFDERTGKEIILPPPDGGKMLGAGDLPPLELPPFKPDGRLKFWEDDKPDDSEDEPPDYPRNVFPPTHRP